MSQVASAGGETLHTTWLANGLFHGQCINKLGLTENVFYNDPNINYSY